MRNATPCPHCLQSSKPEPMAKAGPILLDYAIAARLPGNSEKEIIPPLLCGDEAQEVFNDAKEMFAITAQPGTEIYLLWREHSNGPWRVKETHIFN